MNNANKNTKCQRCNGTKTTSAASRRSRCGGCDRLVCWKCCTRGGSGTGANSTRWAQCFDCSRAESDERHDRLRAESKARGDSRCAFCEESFRTCRDQRMKDQARRGDEKKTFSEGANQA